MGGSAKTVASLGAGAPRFMEEGELGFVLDAVRSETNTYVALVDDDSPIPIPYPGAWDQWAIATIDLKTFNVVRSPLRPVLLEGTNSVSGLGLPSLRYFQMQMDRREGAIVA